MISYQDNRKSNGSRIIKRIQKRINEEENSFQVLLLGETGSGKSLSALEVCTQIDPTFGVDRVVFTPQDFLKLLNTGIQKGSTILADEIGMWLGSREWNTIQNRLMSLVLQTYRYRQLCVIWTLPHSRMADINLRNLCHAIIETVKIDRTNQQVICKFKYRTVNPLSGKAYDKFYRKRETNGDKRTLTRIRINRPKKKLEDEYMKKKAEHMNNVYNNIERDINNMISKSVAKEGKKNVEGKKAHCNNCNYDWITKSISKHPCCPLCRRYKTTTTVIS